jgi:hypothetical protein
MTSSVSQVALYLPSVRPRSGGETGARKSRRSFVALPAISSSCCRDGAVVDYPQIESRQHTDD